jgi:hypothetical protein
MVIHNYDKECILKDNKIIWNIIHGGKGELTLIAPSGNAHTYKYLRPRSHDFPEDVIFVYAMHEGTKFYLGMIERGKFRLTRNSRFDLDTEIVRGAEYIMKLAESPILAVTSPMVLIHNGRCAKCGRELTQPKWKAIGFGRKCNKKNEIK